MRAVVFDGRRGVKVDDVALPVLEEEGDAIVRVTLTAICGSDLHLLTGKTPGMRRGGTIGHEFVGEVEEVGPEADRIEPGARVLGSFLIACGRCPQCLRRRYNFCGARRILGSGRLTGDLEGAQAEYVRVPRAEVNLKLLDHSLSDEQALFGGDILATGLYAAALAGAGSEGVAVVLGAGPVGLLCAAALRRSGAPVMVLDTDGARVSFAREHMGFDSHDVSARPAEEVVSELTGGAMADAALECVGASPAFRSAMRCVREGGRVVVVGVYGSERYELPMGMSWLRGVDIRFAGMANVQAHWDDALAAVASGDIDPVELITHRLPLDEAERGYDLFASRTAMKVVLRPGA